METLNTNTRNECPPDAIPLWERADGIAGCVTGLISFVVYVWTLQPNVGLLDSGEFLVAAQHFGVPHPTGYPLWTLLAWLFQLLPLGNAAWEINLFSAVCGALSVALATALTRSFLRWLMPDDLARWPGLATTISTTCGLLYAFSFSVWSQAVITEVYTLHALMTGLFLTSLYAWLRNPVRLPLLLGSFFLLALGFSNHHLFLALAPLPYLVVLLVRRDLFFDLLAASLVTVLLAYLAFARLSDDYAVLKTAIRFFYCAAPVFIGYVVWRKFRIEWKLVAYLPCAIAFGLLPYGYMPLASSTNPPMNWSYTRTPEGFFYAFNRSQYSGSLTQQSLRSLGPFMGIVPENPRATLEAETPKIRASLFERAQDWSGFLWLQLGRSFTPLGILAYFAALFVIFRLGDVRRRTWVYLLELGFVLAAFLQPIADKATIDAGGWWVQMPYHTYTNLIFAFLMALGLAKGATTLFTRLPRLASARFLLGALPIVPLVLNFAECGQRGHWFGWEFGHEMLADLPQGSVFYGGTDPGRFVPTYMILGESGQPAHLKRDPAFDRRDLYIITQNGVGEPLYMKYLRDHYTSARPPVRSAFERWLGRDHAYPAVPLDFPSEKEIRDAIKKEVAKSKEDDAPPSDPGVLPHEVTTRLIWEKNRDKHEFFVEESFPLKWSYDHALPHGLVYRINKEPLDALPADVVRKDMDFWQSYTEKLLADPHYLHDYDARRSFSKLRSTTGNIYRHRKMTKEAEIAYRQSLLLWPGNPEALNEIRQILWDRSDFEGYLTIVGLANDEDPNNFEMWRLRFFAEKRKETDAQIRDLQAALAKDPSDREKTEKLIGLQVAVDDKTAVAALLDSAIPRFKENPPFLREAARLAEPHKLIKQQVKAAEALVAVEPDKAENFLLLAKARFLEKDKPAFLEAARKAIELGGLTARESLLQSPLFSPWRKDPEFQKLAK